MYYYVSIYIYNSYIYIHLYVNPSTQESLKNLTGDTQPEGYLFRQGNVSENPGRKLIPVSLYRLKPTMP